MNLLLYGFTKMQTSSTTAPSVDIRNRDWGEGIELPTDALASIDTLFSWGRGVVVVIGIIGVLFCAGKMAVGKFGRSDLAAEGVGGLVWTILGISLMLIAVPLITALLPALSTET
ncbi:hypothetical protein [Thermobifida halotolerans]|uniref:hypothetical protein n=1 Tax=Thermobifida halotolerans TaxID=483545 RepID=UPI000AAA51A6|nr:hypothetical protein [Thermobifida halotolerans]